MPPEELERHSAILDRSRNRSEIAASACVLAGSDDDNAVTDLGRHLRSAEFLSRLDDTSRPESDIENFAFVFAQLTLHPVPATGRLCEQLYREPEFRAIPVRVNFLLTALAAVVPVTEGGAQVFRESSAEGFAEVNGPLLTANQSPLALQVFEEIITGDRVDLRPKIEILHRSVLPRRTDAPVLATCTRLLDAHLAREVRDAMIESLYDYQPGPWFGPVRNAPRPPKWEDASTEVLGKFVTLAVRLERQGLAAPLQSAVAASRTRIEDILKTRPR